MRIFITNYVQIKLLDICLQFQTNEKDKKKCRELFNEIGSLKKFYDRKYKFTYTNNFYIINFFFFILF